MALPKVTALRSRPTIDEGSYPQSAHSRSSVTQSAARKALSPVAPSQWNGTGRVIMRPWGYPLSGGMVPGSALAQCQNRPDSVARLAIS